MAAVIACRMRFVKPCGAHSFRRCMSNIDLTDSRWMSSDDSDQQNEHPFSQFGSVAALERNANRPFILDAIGMQVFRVQQATEDGVTEKRFKELGLSSFGVLKKRADIKKFEIQRASTKPMKLSSAPFSGNFASLNSTRNLSKDEVDSMFPDDEEVTSNPANSEGPLMDALFQYSDNRRPRNPRGNPILPEEMDWLTPNTQAPPRPSEDLEKLRAKFNLVPKKHECTFCPQGRDEEARPVPDLLDTEGLENFLSERGRILPRRLTRLCSKHQRQVRMNIQRSRCTGIIAASRYDRPEYLKRWPDQKVDYDTGGNEEAQEEDSGVQRNEMEEIKKHVLPQIEERKKNMFPEIEKLFRYRESLAKQRSWWKHSSRFAGSSLLEEKIKENLIFFRDQDLVASVLEKDIQMIYFKFDRLMSDISEYQKLFKTDSLKGDVPEKV